MTTTKKARGLNRPRKPINFQIPRTDSSIASDQESASHGLRRYILLLDLIVRRHKNQHRSQLFFKQVQTLRRALRQLLNLYTQLDELSATKLAKSAEELRRRFEQEANLRSQREVAEEHIREVLVPKCYVAFSNVVADLPFANLGVVLMGILSEVAAGKNGIGLPVVTNEGDGSHVERAQTTGGQGRSSRSLSGTEEPLVLGISTRMTGEDHGEIIERRYGHKEKLTYEHAEPVPIGLQDLEKDGLGVSAHIVSDNGCTKSVELDVSKPVESSAVDVERSKSKIKDKKSKKKKNALDDLFSKLI